jgi:hypothetical protein
MFPPSEAFGIPAIHGYQAKSTSSVIHRATLERGVSAIEEVCAAGGAP